MSVSINDSSLNFFISIAFKQLRWWPLELKQELNKLQLWQDVRQTVFLSAIEAYQRTSSLRETSNITQRNLYAFLRANGFRRSRGHGMKYVRAGFDTPICEGRHNH